MKKLALYANPIEKIRLTPRTFVKLSSSTFSAFRSSAKSSLPVSIGIECSAVCNLRCKMCFTPNDLNRKKGIMKFSAFKKIIDQTRPLYLGLSGAGEPFLNKDIFKMIEYARKKGAIVNVISNATLIDRDIADKIIKSKLDILKLSIDSAEKETYEKIRIGATFEKTIANVKGIMKAKKMYNSDKPELSINVVVFKDTVREIKKMITFCKKEFDAYPEFIPMFTYGKDVSKEFKLPKGFEEYIYAGIKEAKKFGWNKTVDNLNSILHDAKNMYEKKFSGPCFLPWFSLCITWNGDVFPCCHFINHPIKIGNVVKSPFKKVWNGKNYKEFRKNLVKKRGLYPQCVTCGMNDKGLCNLFSNLTKTVPPLRLLTHRKYG